MCKKVLNILPKIVKSVQTIERLKRAFICYSVPEITAFWNEVGSGCKKPNPFKKLWFYKKYFFAELYVRYPKVYLDSKFKCELALEEFETTFKLTSFNIILEFSKTSDFYALL